MNDRMFYDAFTSNPANFPSDALEKAKLHRLAARELSRKLSSGEIVRDPEAVEDGVDYVYALDTTATHILHSAGISIYAADDVAA